MIRNLVCKVSFLHTEQIYRRIETVPFSIWKCLFFVITVFFSRFSKNAQKPTQAAMKHKIYDGKGKDN